jgi:2-dehydropantoate 2-reductase
MIDASVLVVGAGAIGGVAAAKMRGGVRRVSVLDANKEHVGMMRDPGLLLDELGEERHVRLDAHADPSTLEGPFGKRADEALEVAMGYAGATKASMLQDLEKGAKTEVDVINGVVRMGREYNVETPLNARVVDLMHAMERGERRPGRDAFEGLTG